MQMYETPNEPTGLVYDAQGNKWRKDENYRFECSYQGHTGLRVWPAIGYAEFQSWPDRRHRPGAPGQERSKIMGYQVYEDSKTGRWSGYGVPAECDRPDCATKIDRGLAYRCEDHGHWRPLLGVVHSGQTGIPISKIEEEWVEEEGCGLFFCPTHLPNLALHYGILPKGESPEWLHHILTHESWAQWRKENPDKAKEYRYRLSEDEQEEEG